MLGQAAAGTAGPYNNSRRRGRVQVIIGDMKERSVIDAARDAVRLRKPPPWLEHVWYNNVRLAMPVV